MLWVPSAGTGSTMKMLNSASQLRTIGGAAVTDAERDGAKDALKLWEKEARAGVLGGRGKKRGPGEAGERPPEPSPMVAAVAAALAAPKMVDVADTHALVTSLVDALRDRIAGPLATGLEDHAVPIARALAKHVAAPLAAALKPGMGRNMVAAVKSITITRKHVDCVIHSPYNVFCWKVGTREGWWTRDGAWGRGGD